VLCGESLMPRANNEFDILPSVLDRLLDDEPDVSHEPLPARFFSPRQLTQAVARDLEALLNTRQEALEELPPEFAEVGHSLRTYGLPDFTTLSLTNPQDRQRIRRALEQAIAVFEPRLDRVRVTVEAPQQYDQVLHFRVEALLRVDPAPMPVTFDATLLKTQEYTVQGTD
jgi:type VI secretion system protein ImpF